MLEFKTRMFKIPANTPAKYAISGTEPGFAWRRPHIWAVLKVLRIINRFNLGGPTYNAGYLARHVAAETRLVGGGPAPGEAHSGFVLDAMGVAYEEIPEMGRRLSLVDDWRAFRRIRRIIREFRPDVVHTHAAKAGALGRLAAWMEGVPVVVHTYHGHVFSGYFPGWKSWLVRAAERWLARRTTAIVTISPAQFDDITRVYRICPPARARMIPLGFDLQRFGQGMDVKKQDFRRKYSAAPGTLYIGIIGRLAPVKDHVLFLDAMNALAQRGLSFAALVIGDGELRSQLEEHARGLPGLRLDGPDRNLVFTSWIHQVETALAGLDLVVLTSVNEGTPVSLIEAQAAGVPVVATDVGGVRDCFADGETGLLVKQRKPGAVAEAILSLATDAALRQKMGAAGRHFVQQRFSYQRLVSEMESLYHELLKNNKRR